MPVHVTELLHHSCNPGEKLKRCADLEWEGRELIDHPLKLHPEILSGPLVDWNLKVGVFQVEANGLS